MVDVAFRSYLPYHKNGVVAPVLITDDSPVFTSINTLVIASSLPAGEYVLNAGWEWWIEDVNDSALFRVASSITQGTIYSLEPKDQSDLRFDSASAPFTFAGGPITFDLQASKTDGAQNLTVNWSSIEFERKA